MQGIGGWIWDSVLEEPRLQAELNGPSLWGLKRSEYRENVCSGGLVTETLSGPVLWVRFWQVIWLLSSVDKYLGFVF